MNLVLIGMPGAGKTSVGRTLARMTGRRFLDTDEEIAAQFGGISSLFREKGEAFFRAEEAVLCRALTGEDGLVIATGGGTILDAENVALLKKNGRMFYLRAEEATLLSRLQNGKGRPLLEGDLAENFSRLLTEREALYGACADVTVDTDDLSVREVAKKIWEASV